MSYSVIVPFFNEEKTLETAVLNLLKEAFASEIILVNDGSYDESLKIATRLSKEQTSIKLIDSKENKGKGHALKLGIKESTKKYIGIFDADLEYYPKDLKKLFQEIDEKKLDLVWGSRFIGNSRRNNLYRRTLFANYFLSKLFSMIYKNKVTDVASCYKMIPTDYFKKIKIESSGFEFEIEVLAKYLNIHNKISEVPIKYSGRSYAEGKKIKSIDGFKYIYWMFKCKKWKI